MNFQTYPKDDCVVFRLGKYQVEMKNNCTDKELALAFIVLGKKVRENDKESL